MTGGLKKVTINNKQDKMEYFGWTIENNGNPQIAPYRGNINTDYLNYEEALENTILLYEGYVNIPVSGPGI